MASISNECCLANSGRLYRNNSVYFELSGLVEQMGDDVFISGELDSWPSKSEMADLLRGAGFSVNVGTYSIRLDDCEHFVFQEYGGEIDPPTIDADGSSLDAMLHDGNRVSEALASCGIRHRFEIYNLDGDMVGYIHHQWPLPDEPPSSTNFEWLSPWWSTASQDDEFHATFKRELESELCSDHLLYGIDTRLIARGNGDDALFELLDGSGRLAVVHLTWARHPEPLPWPGTEIYNSLESFVIERMMPEHSQKDT